MSALLNWFKLVYGPFGQNTFENIYFNPIPNQWLEPIYNVSDIELSDGQKLISSDEISKQEMEVLHSPIIHANYRKMYAHIIRILPEGSEAYKINVFQAFFGYLIEQT